MIARKKEIRILKDYFHKKESQLLVIHGRRRIGKTYLVDYMFGEFKEKHIFFKFTGSANLKSSIQIDYFLEAINEWFKERPTVEINEWHKAFIFLNKIIKSKKEKIVIFIDEVAWVDRNNKSGFLNAFAHFYNTYKEKNDNLLAILCGSNASWIKNKILKDSRGPLYHRVDKEIALKPFDLKETKQYLEEKNGFKVGDKNIPDIYMAIGGIAKYLDYLDPNLFMNENMNNLFFDINAPLYNEYESMFKSLFADKGSHYKKIINHLSTKRIGYTLKELETQLKIKRTSLQQHIDDLIDTGFIRGMNRFSQTSKDIRYMIIDSFVLFHHKWIKGISKNDLALYNSYYDTLLNEPSYKIWQGFAFEVLCISNIHLYLQARGIKQHIKHMGYWSYIAQNKAEKGAQIDILIEYENHTYDIVECKYYNKEFTINKDYADNLENKIDKFKETIKTKKYDLKLVMLSAYGTKDNAYSKGLVNQDITLSDILD